MSPCRDGYDPNCPECQRELAPVPATSPPTVERDGHHVLVGKREPLLEGSEAAASPPTDVVSENNRVELRKALFADPAASPSGETETGEGHAERLERWVCESCGEEFDHPMPDGHARWVTSYNIDGPYPDREHCGPVTLASPSEQRWEAHRTEHAARLLLSMADDIAADHKGDLVDDEIALRAGAEALQDNAILDMNLSAAREEIEALAEGQAQLRERIRVLEARLVKRNRAARAALAPPADRTTKEEP